MKWLFIFLNLVTFISCSENAKVNETTNAGSTAIIDSTTNDHASNTTLSITGCYMKVLNQDTVLLQLQQKGENINGKMVFDNFEKDGSHGLVNGKIKGDTLILIYDFFSEGMKSVSEELFKIRDSQLVRASGNIGMRGDTVFYKRDGALQFKNDNDFIKTSCDSL
ncbi:MAG TPA: hypothetical protein VIQ00_04665 [Chitinophagaceae bacterium]|jgi:hypothetical protein